MNQLLKPQLIQEVSKKIPRKINKKIKRIHNDIDLRQKKDILLILS